MFKNFFSTLYAALFPAPCLLCGGSGTAIFCPDCVADFPRMAEGTYCPQCAGTETAGSICGACLKKPPHFDSCTALFFYDFPVDHAIMALKYGHQLALAPWFADQLAAVPLLAKRSVGIDRLIPLPLHPSRLVERGFNQSQEIAKRLHHRLGIRLDFSALQRTRATLPQASLPFKSRVNNVKNAFECRVDLDGERLLLVDDVMTTGATLNEAARVLKLHGAKEVHLAIVARTVRH